MLPKLKASGERGSWFAKIIEGRGFEGQSFPCVHNHWWRASNHSYLDPEAKAGERKWDEYIAALKRQKQAILTQDKFSESGAFERMGYIALYDIDDVKVTDAGLEFLFTKRVADLE